jgi:hypothetical protein
MGAFWLCAHIAVCVSPRNGSALLHNLGHAPKTNNIISISARAIQDQFLWATSRYILF